MLYLLPLQNHFHKKISIARLRRVYKGLFLLYKWLRKITSRSEDMCQWWWAVHTKEKLTLLKFLMLLNNCLIWDVMKCPWEILLEKELHKKLLNWWKSSRNSLLKSWLFISTTLSIMQLRTSSLQPLSVICLLFPGIRVVDSSIGGLGGCPYSMKPVGNVCT